MRAELRRAWLLLQGQLALLVGVEREWERAGRLRGPPPLVGQVVLRLLPQVGQVMLPLAGRLLVPPLLVPPPLVGLV
jgi:hypothetical protein